MVIEPMEERVRWGYGLGPLSVRVKRRNHGRMVDASFVGRVQMRLVYLRVINRSVIVFEE